MMTQEAQAPCGWIVYTADRVPTLCGEPSVTIERDVAMVDGTSKDIPFCQTHLDDYVAVMTWKPPVAGSCLEEEGL